MSSRIRFGAVVLLVASGITALALLRPSAGPVTTSPSPLAVAPSSNAVTTPPRTVGPPLPIGPADRRFRNRQLNYEIDLIGPWRYSQEISIAPGFGTLSTARDVFTLRSPVEDREMVRQGTGVAEQFSFFIWAFADPQGLEAVEWANTFNVPVGGQVGKVEAVAVAGRSGASRSYADGTVLEFVRDGIAMYQIGSQLGDPKNRPTGFSESDVRAMRDSFRFIEATQLRPNEGIISGHLSYPSDFIPAMAIYAIDVADASRWYRTDVSGNRDSLWYRIAGVPTGSYFVVAYASFASPSPTFVDAFTNAVPCGLTSACTDHRLAPVTVEAATQATGVDPADFSPLPRLPRPGP